MAYKQYFKKKSDQAYLKALNFPQLKHIKNTISIYTIKVERIEILSHSKWTTLTPHRWSHTVGLKIVDRRWIDENSYF